MCLTLVGLLYKWNKDKSKKQGDQPEGNPADNLGPRPVNPANVRPLKNPAGKRTRSGSSADDQAPIPMATNPYQPAPPPYQNNGIRA
ncbi:hypothetical protein N7468_006108 [Penicillium chermesinum]|uniref:Uncharacterized protein n=1 Tax=Penicillium chermesinum TaxID=63820 RepID=A0A9W9TNV7_9EURO|nr:uncharacterized protein N7468_006108 [Penicillium chermesinum]KAJ5233152.1 hypothetical protein N7468_006108 [Penicillium chermesinum]KAJ6172788.1 hypothetical protein N7470_001855 [Penicillium chermesinum]